MYRHLRLLSWPLCECVRARASALRDGATPHSCRAGFRVRDGCPGQVASGGARSSFSKALPQGLEAPTLKRFRGALRGTTYRRSRKETRGRKRKLSRKAVLKMNVVRKRLIKKVDQQREVRWEDIHKASRAPKTHRSTLGRCRAVPIRWFLHGVGVSWEEGKALFVFWGRVAVSPGWSRMHALLECS